MREEVVKAVEASRSPRVDALIERVMQAHPGFGVSAQARYYEAVHQELAPLARDLEARAEQAEALLRDVLDGYYTPPRLAERITAHLTKDTP